MVFAVLAGRYVFLGLGLVTASSVLYTCITDGTPFRSELLTPWMSATLIDFYVNVILITSWVWYKESSWTSCLIWTVLLFCFGSVTACWYVAFEFFKMSPDDPVHLVLLKDRTSRHRFIDDVLEAARGPDKIGSWSATKSLEVAFGKKRWASNSVLDSSDYMTSIH